MKDILENQFVRVAKKYANVVVLGSAETSETINFSKIFQERFFNFGFGEENLISAAVGFTVRGKMPIILLPANLMMRIYDQLNEDICRPNLNVKMIFFGETDDVDGFKMLPNSEFYRLKNGEELENLIKKMLDNYGPVFLSISNIL